MPAVIRVLHVIDSFDLGGAQEALVNLIAHTDRTRFAPEVAAMHGSGVYRARFAALGIPVHSLSPSRLIPLYFWNLLLLLRRGDFTIIHCHLFAANLLAKPLAALCGIRIRFNHDQANDRVPGSLRQILDARTNRLSTHICAVSRSIITFLIKHERVPAARISLVYNAIDLQRFTPNPGQRRTLREMWDLPADAPVIAGIGRLAFQKNFALFIEIAREIRHTHPQAIFVLVGAGPDEAALRLAAGDDVRFLGFIADTAPLYDAIDFLLMPSRFEGLPMTLLEAMAMNVPVVASRLDGIAEIVEDGVDGLLAAAEDRTAFVAHLRTLLNDRAKAQALAQRAREKVKDQFSAQRMAREVEALYERYLPPAG